jgi:hypothetical protein
MFVHYFVDNVVDGFSLEGLLEGTELIQRATEHPNINFVVVG